MPPQLPLPTEIIEQILLMVDDYFIPTGRNDYDRMVYMHWLPSLARTCKQFHVIMQNDRFWKLRLMKDFPSLRIDLLASPPKSYRNMHHALWRKRKAFHMFSFGEGYHEIGRDTYHDEGTEIGEVELCGSRLFQDVSMSSTGTLCITHDGISCWGWRDCGANREEGFYLEQSTGHNLISIAAGLKHGMALTRNGEVMSEIRFITAERFVKVDGTESHIIALNSRGDLFIYDSQLLNCCRIVRGNRYTEIAASVALYAAYRTGVDTLVHIHHWDGRVFKVPPLNGIQVKQVALGDSLYCILSVNGELWFWGRGIHDNDDGTPGPPGPWTSDTRTPDDCFNYDRLLHFGKESSSPIMFVKIDIAGRNAAVIGINKTMI